VLPIPASLGDWAAGSGSVPANAGLVFVITTIGVFPAGSRAAGGGGGGGERAAGAPAYFASTLRARLFREIIA
jgi:hypothetical protein